MKIKKIFIQILLHQIGFIYCFMFSDTFRNFFSFFRNDASKEPETNKEVEQNSLTSDENPNSKAPTEEENSAPPSNVEASNIENQNSKTLNEEENPATCSNTKPSSDEKSSLEKVDPDSKIANSHDDLPNKKTAKSDYAKETVIKENKKKLREGGSPRKKLRERENDIETDENTSNQMEYTIPEQKMLYSKKKRPNEN